MNLSRKLVGILSSPSPGKPLLHPLFVLQVSLCSTTSTTKQKNSRKQSKSEASTSESNDPPSPSPPPLSQHDDIGVSTDSGVPQKVVKTHSVWPRPSEIPWQAKVANSVSLIGSVTVPVQFQASPDGKYWAGTILTQEKTPLWIPIIFEGDLAHVATCHLKEKDIIHVAGQLSGDPPQVTMEQGQSNIQVMVHSINFVQESHSRMESHLSFKQDKQTLNFPGKGSYQSNIKSGEESWKNLVENLDKWWDNRFNKTNKKAPDFKHKDTGEVLWLNCAPAWVLPKLPQTKSADVAVGNRGEESWKNLIENPADWWDNRSNKINIKSPDFKHKDTGEGLWLDTAPAWILHKLPPIKSTNAAVGKGGDQSWKNLVENSDNWLDNRSSKRTKNYPDFRHKTTGEGLWVDSAPAWVLPKLPPVKSTGTPVWKRDTLLS